MTTTPSVLLLHDGELHDVLELLDELGVDYLQLRGGAVPERVDPPEKLFVATARHAMRAGKWSAGPSAPHRPYKIGIVAEDSNTLRSMLRRIGFDLLIRRPVHPYALRLLILRALYTGDERRRESRVPIGYEISYRSGVRRKKAMLLDLNTRGCRLLSERPLKIGSRLTLDLPEEITGGRSMQLRSKVIRSTDEGGAAGAQRAVALGFENLSVRNRRRLTEILEQRASGPLALSKAMAAASGAVTKSDASARDNERTPLAAAGSPEDRRKNPRASYDRSVRSVDEEANLVLMGRDLSVGGMRIEPHSGLAIGTKLRLAIYGEPREDPFIVRARVVRNDGDEGMGLRFEQIPSGVAARLESLVATLPSVESLHGGETDALGSVVSRILESES